MFIANFQRARLLGVALALGALFALPARVFADCRCGTDCGCGDGCTCQLPLDPPPPDPNANQVRKNQRSLTDDERQAFVDAVLQLKQTFRPDRTISIYDEYVLLHMMAMDNYNVHEGSAFCPWHRVLLRNFELELQAIDPTVTIPYWDFSVDNQPDSSIWSSDFMGGTGDPDNNYSVMDGPFAAGNWQLVFDGPNLRRDFSGPFAITLPTPDDVATGFLVEQYDSDPFDASSDITMSFRNYVTGWNFPSGDGEMHNKVHEWIGGSMLSMYSPNDPVFFLMHAYVDLLWAQWEGIHGYDYPESGAQPGHNLYDRMYHFGVTPASVLDHHVLGYRYDIEVIDH
jgi:tyrosinase